MKLHWLGVASSANCVEIRGGEKSQFFFQLKDQSLICKCVFQQCSATGGQQKGDFIKFLSITFDILFLIAVELEVFLRIFFPCLVWQGEARDSFLFSEVDSVLTLVDQKPKLQESPHPQKLF